jgi:UBX domain-containing protein 1
MSDLTDRDREDMAIQLSDVTGSSLVTATNYLTAHDWDLDSAAAALLADGDEAAASGGQGSSSSAARTPLPQAAPAAAPSSSTHTGPRRLDGTPVDPSSYPAPRDAARQPPRKTGIATLGSLGGSGGGGGHSSHGHHPSDDDDDNDDENHGRGDLFAGGEKSGLAVQDPSERSTRKLVDDIVRQARSRAPHAHPSDEPPAPERFRGTARTLGGDGVESRVIPDPRGNAPTPRVPQGPVQSRTLYLWRDGFSIDDGPLHRFDDPENAADLVLIRQGRAPMHLMNINYDQPVDVKLEQRDENWHQLPRIYRPFDGVGRRLGAPTPGDAPPPEPTTVAVAATSASPAGAAAPSTAITPPPPIAIDDSQPVITIRIQLPTGARLPVRFNTTHTIGDVYAVVRQSSPEMAARQWIVATTFPNKDHTDHGEVLGDMPEFRRGGTAAIKWV